MPRCYTLPCDFLRIKQFLKGLDLYAMLRFAYNSIPKGTRCAMNCLKMHFVSIFAASAEVFIRCLVIPAHSNFPFAYNSILKETSCAINCLKMHFVSIFAASVEVFIRCAVIPLTRIFILRIIPFPKEPKPQRTAKKCISFPFLRHLQKFLYAAP